jgi:hypothetical protein
MNNNHQSSLVEFLSGEKVYLRAIEPDDLALLHRWANDPETRGQTGEVRSSTYAATLEFYQKVQKMKIASGWEWFCERPTRSLVKQDCCECSRLGDLQIGA